MIFLHLHLQKKIIMETEIFCINLMNHMTHRQDQQTTMALVLGIMILEQEIGQFWPLTHPQQPITLISQPQYPIYHYLRILGI